LRFREEAQYARNLHNLCTVIGPRNANQHAVVIDSMPGQPQRLTIRHRPSWRLRPNVLDRRRVDLEGPGNHRVGQPRTSVVVIHLEQGWNAGESDAGTDQGGQIRALIIG